ncbi:hypothetical protein VB715_14850 [Crocosphaera sp. UHCC 0190]|uniref:hypothetical protein n=1 Tax=Crocosphaera sp. UHCC 0190 TaxID=3110246 RepID=UPI002B209778|nr:hypothetical protein [Crocosphaera sp. UHCC 0190]MEA5511050.1 hypothetical protein [Crocosphaera sp. UHCC 0190]
MVKKSEQTIDKKEINLSPKEIAEPINKNLKDRYQGLIEEEESDTLNLWESNDIIKKIDAERSELTLDKTRVSIPDSTQKILGLFPSSNLNFNHESSSIGTLIFSPISIGILTLVSGIILIQKKDIIHQLLLGENGLSEQIMEFLGLAKLKVSQTAIFLHNRALVDAKILAKSLKAIEQDKFSKQEFLLFAKIKFCVQYNRQEYEGLNQSIECLKSALKAQKSYVIMDQIELMCQGIKQKEFYDHVYQELKKYEDPEVFQSNIKQKLTAIIPQIKTDEGKHNLQVYAQELDSLCKNDFSLRLFSLFTQKQLKEFSILQSTSEIISNLKEQDLMNLKVLTCLVMVHYDMFEESGKMINITGKKSSPDTYARIIQYLALENRHQQAYIQFEKLIEVLRQWHPFYQAVSKIREEYPPENYRQPKDFNQEIPGLDLYLKYKNYLTDRQTGYTYIDFGEEQ